MRVHARAGGCACGRPGMPIRAQCRTVGRGEEGGNHACMGTVKYGGKHILNKGRGASVWPVAHLIQPMWHVNPARVALRGLQVRQP